MKTYIIKSRASSQEGQEEIKSKIASNLKYDRAVFVLKMDPEPTFAPLEESKEEFEGLYHSGPRGEAGKDARTEGRPPRALGPNSALVLIAVLLFAIIVIAINEHYSRKVTALLGGGGAAAAEEQLLKAALLEKQLKDIEGNGARVAAKLGEVSRKIDALNREPLNIVDTAAPSNRAETEDAAELRAGVQALAKELSAIRYDIATVSKTVQKDAAFTAEELVAVKELLKAHTEEERGEEEGPRGHAPAAQAKDERQFEADFVVETPEEIAEEPFTASSEVFVDKKYVFDIPKKLWMYGAPPSSYMAELVHTNNAHFAKKSNFDLLILNRSNYKTHLSTKTAEKVQKFIKLLQKRATVKETMNVKSHLQRITKNYILLNVLSENGGVMTNGQFAMTEDLSWVKDIMRNQYVNRGNRGIKPQVVGFYSVDYTSEKSKANIKPFPGMNAVDKYMAVLPSLEDYFIAAQKNTRFMSSLIARITKLLKNPLDFRRQRGHYQLKNLKGEDIYYEYFLIAVQTVLQDKQNQIDMASIDKYRHFAIDYYGLSLINCHYAPYKLKALWGNSQSSKAFQSLSQYPEEELLANIGPLRYIIKLTPVSEMNAYFRDTKEGKRKPILEGSFIQKIFYPNITGPFFRKNQQKSFVNKTNQPWLSLPKIIWVFWDKGLDNAKVNNQICVQNLRRMGALSGFVVNEVNLSNINSYLDAETLLKINSSLANAKLRIFPQSQSDAYRLALLAKYGGIYMDASWVAVENFDWIVNIGRYPSEFIFNRFGHLPKVFMMWHPHYGSPLEWTINAKHNTKDQWHLAYENNFIAAEKDSELIKEWFELLLQLYLKPYSQVQKVFQDCLMYSHKWSTTNWHYLIPMDTVKCVIGRREAKLLKEGKKEFASASDYYKIWSMSGYLGQQKLRSNTNFDRPGSEDHLFVYRYSQEYVEGLIGKVRHLFKFYSQHSKELSMFVGNHMNGNFSSEAHPDSLFMRYMWRKNFKLKEVHFYPKLEVLP